MQKSISVLVFLLLAPAVLFAQQDSAKAKPDVIYDTVFVEKPPVVINKKVYIEDNSKDYFKKFISLQAGYLFLNSNNNKNPEELSLNNSNSVYPVISAGIKSKFILKAGVGFYRLKKSLKYRAVTYSKHTEQYTVPDTLDSYFWVSNNDTTWHYVIEERTKTEEKQKKEETDYLYNSKQTVVTIPVQAGIPVDLGKLVITPLIGIELHIPFKSSIQSNEVPEKYYSLSNITLTSHLALELLYPLDQSLYISWNVAYSTYLGEKEAYKVPYTGSTRVSAGITHFF